MEMILSLTSFYLSHCHCPIENDVFQDFDDTTHCLSVTDFKLSVVMCFLFGPESTA